MLRRIIVAICLLIFAVSVREAAAQSSPGLGYGEIPTAQQWNSYFTAKQDYLGFTPVQYQNATNTIIGIARCDGTTTNCVAGVITAVGAAASSIGVGTTTIAAGTGGSLLYNNGGTLGNETLASLLVSPPAIGGTTPAAGSFTSLTAKYTTAGVAPLTIYSGAVATYALVSDGSAGIQIYGQSVGATPANGASIQINSSLNGSGPNLQGGAGIDFVSSQGVIGTPTALNSGDFIGRVGGWGYDGTSFTTTTNANAYIGLETTQAWTSSAHGAKVIVGVTANGSATSATVAIFDQDATLNVVGGYKVNGTAGFTGTKTPSGSCSLTYSGGLLVSTTC